MKKYVLVLLSFFMLLTNVQAKEEITFKDNYLYEATLINSEDASNSWFKIENNVIRTHLLAYDEKNGSLNNEINEYVKNKLTNASKIEIEFDSNKLNKDEYNRYNVFIFVDGELLQSDLIKLGYGSVNFVTDNYKYLDTLCDNEKTAIINDAGIWNYEGIKEDYCKSGIEIGSDHTIYKEEANTEVRKDNKELKYLVLLNSGIVLLVILLAFRRKN